MMRPIPPPNGTVHTPPALSSPLAASSLPIAFQFAVRVGPLVR
jgi:hypothetical protein